MKKLELTKEYKAYYSASSIPVLANFGEVLYLTIPGKGEPEGKVFTERTGTLYSVAYTVKNICKKQDNDFAVAKLEGLWWVETDQPYLTVPRSEWNWKLLIRMPYFVTAGILQQAVDEVISKKKNIIAGEVALETINEGNTVNILHIGSYASEPATLQLVKDFMNKNKYERNGYHHEIYLSDPNKTSAEKLKTILRQPVK